MADKLTDDELEQLRLLLPIAEQIKAEAEYRAAQRLVFETWRKGIIYVAAAGAALFALRDQIAAALGVK
jgi:hypothetical protein